MEKFFDFIVMCFMFAYILSFPIACVGLGVFTIVKSILSSKKGGSGIKIFLSILTFLCIVFAISAWFLNFGWCRFFLTIIPIPFVYSAFFVISNYTASVYVKKSLSLKISMVLSYISYIAAFALFPDGGDIGGMYAFFALIKDKAVVEICSCVSIFAFALSIACLVYQIVKSLKIRSAMKRNIKEATS